MKVRAAIFYRKADQVAAVRTSSLLSVGRTAEPKSDVVQKGKVHLCHVRQRLINKTQIKFAAKQFSFYFSVYL